jgi:hypothetical protein
MPPKSAASWMFLLICLSTCVAGSAQTPATGTAAPAATDAAQAVAQSEKVAKTAQDNAAKAIATAGVALTTTTNVKDNVHVDAVMLPRSSAQRVFGRDIANNYVIVQVTVDNQSEDSSFVLRSIFIDYSEWALSGMTLVAPEACPALKRLRPDQVSTCPGQVSSVEYRVVRGELQDASNWTWRNGFVRATVLVGAIATGLPAFKSKAALGYVSSYTGEFVPGLQVFWPDPAIAQINRISDLGFQTNKVFPKGTADVVYAFFPIDRFLSPGLKKIFVNAPALFVSPAQMFFDLNFNTRHPYQMGLGPGLKSSDVQETRNLIATLAGVTATDPKAQSIAILGALMDPAPCPATGTSDKDAPVTQPCRVKNLFDSISVNRIHIAVGGGMSVNTSTIPASLQMVSIDAGNNTGKVWTTTCTTETASVIGRYLTDGSISVSRMTLADNSTATPSDYFDTLPLTAVADGSDDSTLKFSYQLKSPIPSGSTLYFQITKFDPTDTKKTKGITSMELQFPVVYTTAPGSPALAAVDKSACASRTAAQPAAPATTPAATSPAATTTVVKPN